MKGRGLLGMLVPKEYGGMEIDAVSYSIVFEEISKAWMGVAGVLGTHTMATRLIATDGTDDQKSRWSPDLDTRKIRSGLALTEPGAGTGLQGISTIGRPGWNMYRV